MSGQIGILDSRSYHQRPPRLSWILLLALALAGARTFSQVPGEDDTALRNRAFQLYDQNNYTDALRLLEKLATAHPTDKVVLERLGFVVAATVPHTSDPSERKKIILRARSILLRAKELGDDSNLLKVMLEKLPANGETLPFSSRKEVDDAMREGETAFNKSDFAGAIAGYQRAMALDPLNYDAALFSGDVYFKMNQPDKAGTWFARAIEIDPDRETAYRYWGDSLMKEGKMDEARAKFINSIVAQPYLKTTWIGLKQWADHNGACLSHPKIETPAAPTGQGNQINITIDADSLNKKKFYWIMYPMTRAEWQGDQFKKEFPNEKAYRHSLREEVDALETVVAAASEDARNHRKRKNIDPAVLDLLKLHDESLMEAFVLISRADQGIAQDYVAYRASHRDKISQYISEWIISPNGPKK